MEPIQENQRLNLSGVELSEAVTTIAARIAPTVDEVANWHVVDEALASGWDRPLVRLLRFFVEPPRAVAEAEVLPFEEAQSETVDDKVVVDLVATEILDLTSALSLGGELAS